MKSTRGRHVDNITPILKYTQIFKEYDGTVYTWIWDKEINPNGPLSVTINDPQYAVSDKLIKEIDAIEHKYLPKKGERKLRITKLDKDRLETLKKQLDGQHYYFYSEDFTKNGKIKTTQI